MPGARSIATDVGPDQRHDFRTLVEHAGVVEQTIAEKMTILIGLVNRVRLWP